MHSWPTRSRNREPFSLPPQILYGLHFPKSTEISTDVVFVTYIGDTPGLILGLGIYASTLRENCYSSFTKYCLNPRWIQGLIEFCLLPLSVEEFC